MVKNQSESLLAKIKNASKKHGISVAMGLRRYAYERLLSMIHHNGLDDKFCLKGGVLLGAMFENRMARPTEDLDLNGMEADKNVQQMGELLAVLSRAHDGSDGMVFDPTSIRITKDRDGIIPGGKVNMTALIGSTRITLKVDIGFGNVITPAATKMTMKTLLPEFVAPFPFYAYPIESIISEKMRAVAVHGELNTRFKDYFDIFMLAKYREIEGELLKQALVNTFERFGDKIPNIFPGLSQKFSENKISQQNWSAFVQDTKYGFELTFPETVAYVSEFIMPVIDAIHDDVELGTWSPDGGWAVPSPKSRI